ncbi:MAG: nucleotidyltransferase family protein [Chloroflexia bacterium]|nr:nucleotidyltransferase family protein [Chloroflexia bacterium]
MQAVILAGGMGTRLRQVVQDRPKPMAKVAGKPFLEYQFDLLRRHGIRELILCVGYLGEQIVDYFGDGRRWDIRIDYAFEREALLGTAGAIKNAAPLIQGPFLVLNGDTFFDLDLRCLIQFHQEQKRQDSAVLGTLAVIALDDPAAYGSVQVDGRSRITSFAEKAIGSRPASLVSAGIYLLEPELLDQIPAGQKVSIEKETFPTLLESGWGLSAYIGEGFFVDVGTPAGYSQFQNYIREVSE